MTLDVWHGMFPVGTGGADILLSNIGFSGKVFIFYSVNQMNKDGSYSGDFRYSIGFATLSGGVSDDNRCASMKSVDNVGTSITSSKYSTSRCICFINNSGANIHSYKVNSGDGNSFTLGSVDIDGTTAQSGWVAVDVFGGSDLVDYKVATITTQSGHGTATYALGAGANFSGTVLFMVAAPTSGSVNNSNQQTGYLEIGMATASGEQACISVVSEHASATADTKKWQRTDRLFGGWTSTSALVGQMQFNAFTSGGFQVNWISGRQNGAGPLAVLVMKISGNQKVINWNNISGTGNQDISGVGFSGKYTFFMSANAGAQTAGTPLDDNRLSIGSAINTNPGSGQTAVWAGDQDGPTTMVSTRGTREDRCILAALENATDSSTQTILEADFTSFNANGFSIDKTTNVFSGEFSGMTFGTLVIGQTNSGEPVGAGGDIQRRAFGGANSMQFPSMAMADFGGHMVAESNNRAFFGRPKVWPTFNVSGVLLY